jgi:hypothetical protein
MQTEKIIEIFNYFNQKLFGGILDNKKVHIYQTYYRKSVHGIGLNLLNISGEDMQQFCCTLVHEMLHLSQEIEGTADPKGGHNHDFAKRAKLMGLQPSTARGKETGKYVYTTIIPGGDFERFYKENEENLKLPLVYVALEEDRKPRKKNHYKCPLCGLIARTKPGEKLHHTTCGCDMDYIVTDPISLSNVRIVLDRNVSASTNGTGFGNFDLSRQLSDYEMKHFDEFMKPIDRQTRDVSKVTLTKTVDRIVSAL